MSQEFEYDVALSFAGEQRTYVEAVAAALKAQGVRVFYDAYEKVNLWGKDLYEHLDYVYQRAARYCVIFASADYANKMWTTHERKGAQARAIEENAEYILPARFDSTEIPGIRKTVGYIGLGDVSPEELADLIIQKLGPRQPAKYFPSNTIRLAQTLQVEGSPAEGWATEIARNFYLALTRMTETERLLLLDICIEGCPSALPENVHVSLDLLYRANGTPPAEIRQTLRGLSSLGIQFRTYSSDDHDEEDMIEVEWDNRIVYDDEDEDQFNMERSTDVARAVLLGSSEDFCTGCAKEALVRLDFSALAVPLDEDA